MDEERIQGLFESLKEEVSYFQVGMYAKDLPIIEDVIGIRSSALKDLKHYLFNDITEELQSLNRSTCESSIRHIRYGRIRTFLMLIRSAYDLLAELHSEEAPEGAVDYAAKNARITAIENEIDKAYRWTPED